MIENRKRSLQTVATEQQPSKVRRIMSSLPSRLTTNNNSQHDTNPQEFLHNTFRSKNMDVELVESLQLKNFFQDPTSEEMEGYRSDVLNAVRQSDLDKLRLFHKQGRPLKCSNQFGESLLHLACRRGLVDVVAFLIHEAGVTVRVRDDYGRTPLHDACWTIEPNFELIALIVAECPRLLFMTDKRGHTPLSYARRHQWGAYVDFIKNHEGLLFSKERRIRAD